MHAPWMFLIVCSEKRNRRCVSPHSRTAPLRNVVASVAAIAIGRAHGWPSADSSW